MSNIPIYQAEKSLAKQIRDQYSIAYFTPLESMVSDIQQDIQEELQKGLANIKDESVASHYDSDLYFVKSVLVTTNWNKNDDVFNPQETWTARHTPSHKPTNLEHDEAQLVGHIVDSFPIDEHGCLIRDNCVVEELPSKFHLVTGAVIYKNWEDEALQGRTNDLIRAIEANKKFVSMEVMFTNFDYQIMTPDGQFHVKARNSDTAWMTQHLKSYGGSGSCEGYRIGRLLRNLTFCGKGYVDKPANPESIIFTLNDNGLDINLTNAEENQEIDKSGVLSIGKLSIPIQGDLDKGDMNMSDVLQEQNTELKQTIASLEDKLAVITDQLAKADVEKYEQRIQELTEVAQANKDALETYETDAKSSVEKVKVLEDEVKTLTEAKEKLDVQIAEVEKAKVSANRVSTLVDGGIEKDTAVKKVELFANLSDEQFVAVADELINVVKAQLEAGKTSKETEDKAKNDVSEDEVDEAEVNATDENLENADIVDKSDDNVSVANNDPDEEQKELRAELVQCIVAHIGHSVDSQDEGGK